MKHEVTRARLSLIASMCIFGTIGLVRRYLPVPSGFLAMARGLLGALFLLALVHLRGARLDRDAIRPMLPRLVISGAMIGFNWILLFEAYRYTTVAVATLCYYMAPVFILIVVPFVLHERLTLRKAACLYDRGSGRYVETWTTEPSILTFTGRTFNESYQGKYGPIEKYGAMLLETIHFPDSPNQPRFPSTVLRPGEKYSSVTEFRFSAK